MNGKGLNMGSLIVAILLSASVNVGANERAGTQSDREHFLIDTSSPRDAQRLIEELREAGLEDIDLKQSALVPRHVWVSATAELMEPLKTRDGVVSVIRSMPQVQRFAKSGSRTARGAGMEIKAAAGRVTSAADADAGAGIRVAIISTGVDYTHAAFGGAGTSAAYLEAKANASTRWKAFPVAPFGGGVDFLSETYNAIDPNPLDSDFIGPDSAGDFYPTGRGTKMAAIIHELAPAAELFVYKVWNVYDNGMGWINVAAPTLQDYVRAFDHLLDPNGDGLTDDRVDIVVVESLGGAAFYHPHDEESSVLTAFVEYTQALAARGVLVVAPSGEGTRHRYDISLFGAAPDALTVGATVANESGFALADFSARGPVRGSQHYLKPDMVSVGSGIDVPLVGTGNESTAADGTILAAARIAGLAAALKSRRPALRALELKSLLSATAVHDVKERMPAEAQAPLAAVGLGRDNLEAAINSKALVWVAGSYQPQLNFGYVSAAAPMVITREITVRNLSDTDTSYSITSTTIGGSAASRGVRIEFPDVVRVPAQHQVNVPVTLHINPAELREWPLEATDDYTEAAWNQAMVDGYLTLSAVGAPELSLGWQVIPRARTRIQPDYSSLQELFDSPFGQGFAQFTNELTQQFSNESDKPALFAALPLMHRSMYRAPNRLNARSHETRYVAGGVYPESVCSSDKKLVVAASLWRPTDVAHANYPDVPMVSTEAVMYWEFIRGAAVTTYELDISAGEHNIPLLQDEDFVGFGWVQQDEDGRAVSYYVDLTIPFDPFDATARVRKSILPAYISTHTRNVVAQVCVDELFHHEVDTVADLDENLGVRVLTDRDMLPQPNDPIIQYNPVRYGHITVDAWGTERNSGARVKLRKLTQPSEAPPLHTVRLEPGEKAELHAVEDGSCASLDGTSSCLSRFLLLGLSDDFVLESNVGYGDESTLARPAEGQAFAVSEGALHDTLIATVQLESDGFFGDATSNAFEKFQLVQANALPGDPFHVTPSGDIRVSNPAAIDFERDRQYTLQVRAIRGNDSTRAVDVIVNVTNVNDEAPKYDGALSGIVLRQGEVLELHLAGHFSDVEGDFLTFSADDLPAGLTLDTETGQLVGMLSPGRYTLSVSASDGVHSTAASIDVQVNGAGGGGGASGEFLLSTLLLLAFVSRRRALRVH